MRKISFDSGEPYDFRLLRDIDYAGASIVLSELSVYLLVGPICISRPRSPLCMANALGDPRFLQGINIDNRLRAAFLNSDKMNAITVPKKLGQINKI